MSYVTAFYGACLGAWDRERLYYKAEIDSADLRRLVMQAARSKSGTSGGSMVAVSIVSRDQLSGRLQPLWKLSESPNRYNRREK